MIVIPASLRSDFIHMAGMAIHIALESTIHIVGIRTQGSVHSYPGGLSWQSCVLRDGTRFMAFGQERQLFGREGKHRQRGAKQPVQGRLRLRVDVVREKVAV